jgi:hypothetical protein
MVLTRQVRKRRCNTKSFARSGLCIIKTTAAAGGYEMSGGKKSCRSDVRKHDEMGGTRASGKKASRRACGWGKLEKWTREQGAFNDNVRYRYHTHQAQVTQQGCGWVPWKSLDLRNSEKFVGGWRRGEQGEHQNHRTEEFSRFVPGYHHQEDQSTSRGRDRGHRRQRNDDACL